MQQEVLKYLFTKDRLTTFKNWRYKSSAPCSPLKLAEAGFYVHPSETDNNVATCLYCLKSLYFDEDDDPWLEHQQHSQNCPFVILNKQETDLTVSEFIDLCHDAMRKYLVQRHENLIKDYDKNFQEVISSLNSYNKINL